MFNFWSLTVKHTGFRHLMFVTGVLFTGLAQGQTSPVLYSSTTLNKKVITRMPASYIPDDDVIIKPMDNQLSFYQQYISSDNSEEVVSSRNQLRVWSDNQQFADQYGMDSSLSGPYFVPSSEVKWEYFKNKYMRYLRRRGEQPFKDMPKTWYQEYRASNEVDTIDELEAKFQKSNKAASSSGPRKEKSLLPGSLQEKEVNLWKKTKFIFQPRVDQGLVIVGIKGPIAYARAWVGVNGKTEINIKKDIDSIGFRAMYNYEVDKGKYITSLDQRLMENVYARLTTSHDPRQEVPRDETLMLLYAKQF